MPEHNPRRALLGAELRRIRTLAGASQGDLGLRQPIVSRIENGLRLPSREQVQAWLALADDQTGERIVALLDEAHFSVEQWSDVAATDPTMQRLAAQEIETSRRVRTLSAVVIPGLLQTPGYARAVFTALGRSGEWLDSSVAERVRRQAVIYRPGHALEFLIPEPVLACLLAPDCRTEQLAHLAAVASAVRIGILPATAAARPDASSFILLDPIDGSGTEVQIELLHGMERVNEDGAVDIYRRTWKRLWAAAATGNDAVDLLREALRQDEYP